MVLLIHLIKGRIFKWLKNQGLLLRRKICTLTVGEADGNTDTSKQRENL